MNLPRICVRRKVTTTMLTLIVVVIGIAALFRLRIDLLPDVETPTLSITTVYEGASPEVMERQVTQIVEEIVATVPGVEEITSTSEEGSSRVRVTFGWGVDIDDAALDVRSVMEDELEELPEDIERPQIRKFDVNSFPVVLLGISSDLPAVELTQIAEDQVRYRFNRVPGVAQVDLWGGYYREIRVAVDKDRLSSLGIPLNAVLDALRNANLDLPAGRIEQGRYEVTLRAPAEFREIDEIRRTVVAVENGAPITISQLADVEDTHEKLTQIERINGARGLRVAIRKEATANTVEVSRGILAEVEAIRRAFPQLIVVPVINQGNFIERSISNVARSVLYGGGLAVVVLLLFLRNLGSTTVIALSIPISLFATFAALFFGDFTLNLMTLGGLALGVGMMVDNSIVVLENIFRRASEEREQRHDAAIHGAGEVAGAIVASTLTTLVIFLPLVFVRGVTGVLFQELALVIVFALVCSLLVSLSLVPMLAARLIRQPRAVGGASPDQPGRVSLLNAVYHDFLTRAVRYPGIATLLALVVMAGGWSLLPLLGTEFLPPSDEGEIRVNGEMEPGTRLDLVDQQTKLMEAVVADEVPEAIAVVAQAEEGAEADLRISIGGVLTRDRSNTEVARILRERLVGQVPGMEVRVRAPQGQFLLERLLGGSEGLRIEILGFELETLDALAAQIADRIRDVPGITDVQLEQRAGTPQEELTVNRAKVDDLGLSVRDVVETLETAVAGSPAGEFRTEDDTHRILVQLQGAQQMSIDQVLDLTVQTPRGAQVALRNVLASKSGAGPLTVRRKDQQRIATVTANVADRDLGSVADDVNACLAEIPTPLGYELRIAGNYEEQQKAFEELLLTLALALVLVYMVLACQYESLRDPLIVMFAVPMAGVGVVVTLFMTDTTLNIQSYIGCIMLGGIVVNNAILLVDQAGQLRRGGLPVQAAAIEAGRRRLRPILMTTLTTILGLMPLALGIGEGADAQAPLARAVVGGLGFSTVVTLLLVPAVYCLMHPETADNTPAAGLAEA